jgi:selenocysteine-specific elongation factor
VAHADADATEAGADATGRPPRRRTVIGTAGHIDHGKTALVRALTGIDCDRWQEEKERGITIDLGFAWLRHGDLQVGFVDVPGHERFLHNALAGLGGIGLVLLVVAADEGVKPQTREHLDVCRLLGLHRAVVALTKADLVAADLLELAELEVAELLADTPFADAPRFAVSSLTGQGVDGLREALLAAAAQAAEEAAERETTAGAVPVRLPLDRAFHLKGLGVLVTGTLVSGTVEVGDTLELLPPGKTVRVRSIQVHGAPREAAAAGERTSLQLTGVGLDEVERGMELAEPGRLATSRRFAARLTLLPEAPKPLSGFLPVRVHHFAAEVMGRMRPLGRDEIRPGEEGVVEIRLAAPLTAVRGDRYVVRRPSPQATLGGGVILDPGWRPVRGKELPAALAALGGEEDDVLLLWVRQAGEGGLDDAVAARRLGWPAERVAQRLAALVAEGRVLEVPSGAGHGRRWLDPAALRRVVQRCGRVLKDYFGRQRLARGMPKAEAVERVLPGAAGELADVYLAWLAAQGHLSVAGDLVNLPGREAELTGEESELAKKVVAGFEAGGYTPPSPGELAARFGAKPQIVDGLVRYLTERGRLVRLPDGLVVAAAERDRLREELSASGWESFTVAQFKDRFGLSRKWAIPWLEHLDSVGFTRRVGDERQIV